MNQKFQRSRHASQLISHNCMDKKLLKNDKIKIEKTFTNIIIFLIFYKYYFFKTFYKTLTNINF